MGGKRQNTNLYEAAGYIRCGSAQDDRTKFPKLNQSKYAEHALPAGGVWSIRHMRWYTPRSVEQRYRQDKQRWFACDTEEKKAEWLAALECPQGVLPVPQTSTFSPDQPLAQHTARCTGVPWRGAQQWIEAHRHGNAVHDQNRRPIGTWASHRPDAAQAAACACGMHQDCSSLAGGIRDAQGGDEGIGVAWAPPCDGAGADCISEEGSSQASVIIDPAAEPRGYASDCSLEEQPAGGADDLWEAHVCRLRDSLPDTAPPAAPPTLAASTPVAGQPAPIAEPTRGGDSGLGT